jgi:multimeric flavodoxin WrbA
MKIRKLTDRKIKLLVFQGSARDLDSCPNMESKSSKILDHIVDKFSNFIDFEIIDLSVNQSKKPIIQPCKGCVSTAGGYHCHFPCDCYFKGGKNKDLLSEKDVFTKLLESDCFLIISPIYWHSLTTQIKALFDRLVCINLTLTHDEAVELMGNKIKNSDTTGEMSRSGEYKYMLKNHLSGKYAAFYVHGDDGANDYEGLELPDSFDIESDYIDPLDVVKPYVNQLKYSGVYVPDDFIKSFYINKNKEYYDANKDFDKTVEFLKLADELIENIINKIG